MSTSAPNRREFLQAAVATTLVPLLASSSTAASPARRPWKWAPEPGLWETQHGDDIIAQLHAAADAGFAAFADPQLEMRSRSVQFAFMRATRERQIKLGPLLVSPCYMPTLSMRYVFEVGAACGTTGIRVEQFSRHMPGPSLEPADVRTMLAESIHEEFVRPNADGIPKWPVLFELHLSSEYDLNCYEYWADMIHKVNHPLCRLSVDTYRLASAGIDVVAYMQRHAAIIGHVELADYPGGFEPGSGTLDIAGIVAATALSPHDGVIGLRCGLSRPGQAGLDRLIAAARHHGGLRDEVLA